MAPSVRKQKTKEAQQFAQGQNTEICVNFSPSLDEMLHFMFYQARVVIGSALHAQGLVKVRPPQEWLEIMKDPERKLPGEEKSEIKPRQNILSKINKISLLLSLKQIVY